jgi:hypothetical protein
MAIYPGMVKTRNARSTTIVQPSAAAGHAGSLSSSPSQSSGHVQLTSADAKDPSRLVRAINDVQGQQDASTQAARANPLSSPCIVRDVSFVPFVQQIIKHTLGRPYSEWHSSRHRGLPPALVEVEPGDATYPPGCTPSRVLVLMSQSTCKCNVVIAGD